MGTRLTSKGQVTIPKRLRDELGLRPGDEVEFLQADGHLEVRKAPTESVFRKWAGFLAEYVPDEWKGLTTDEIMVELRGEPPTWGELYGPPPADDEEALHAVVVVVDEPEVAPRAAK